MKMLFAAAPAKAVGMEILLVDDHALIRDALRRALRELVEGATVFEAADFRQAMPLIEQHPDLRLIMEAKRTCSPHL
jgi:CheY-like chemotaxis protein